MLRNMTSERATVLTSALVAIAILGAAVTAQPSRSTAGEKLARLESDLRYQLELESRVNRARSEQRIRALDSVMEAWRKSAQSEGDYKSVVHWLQSAIRASMPGDLGEWPEAPAFRQAAAATPVEHEVRRETVEAPSPEQPATKLERPAATGRRQEAQPKTSAAILNKPITKKQQPPSAVAAQATKTQEPQPLVVHVSDPVPVGAQTLINDAPPAVHTTEPLAGGTPRRQHGSGDKAPESSVIVSAEQPAPTPEQTAAIYNESATVDAVPQPALQPAVEVNLAELNARVGGYHDGLREVEAALVANRRKMTFGELAKLVARLEELVDQCEFVHLYYEALTREERQFVIEPRPLADTVKLVDQQRKLMELLSAEDHFAAVDEWGESELAGRLRVLLESASQEGRSVKCCGARP
jgi:hypothetical protein